MPVQIPQNSMQPVQGGASATNQHIRLPPSENSKPFLTVTPERKSAVQSLCRSLQLGNRQYQGNVTSQDSLIQALLHKLECLPVHDLEPRVRSWQESMPLLETRVQGLLEATSRPDAAPEIVAAYDQAKQELERAKILLIKARSILNRKPAQALHQIPQAHINTFRQVDPQVQVTDRMTAALREPAQPGGHVAEQVPNVFGWKSQPGPSNVLQLPFQVYTPSNSVNPYHSVPSPDHDAGQRDPRPPSLRHGQWDKAVPRNRTSFLPLVRLWLLQTERGIDVIPRIGDKPLDLHELFSDVETLGGAENVQAKRLWPLVWVGMGYTVDEQNDPQPAQIAQFLADVYTSFLVPFKLFCMDRLRPADSVIQDNRLVQQVLAQQVGTRANQGVPPVPEAGPAIVIPTDGTAALPLANFPQILALLQVTLEDWLPELPLQAKIVRAAEMDPPAMQNEGWSAGRINLIWRFRPALWQFRDTVIRQQEQTLSQLPHSKSDIGITGQGGIGDGKAEPSSQSSSPIKHPSISGQESGREKGETESKVEKPAARGKKRRLEGKHEQSADGQGATPKRGKITHQVR